MYQMIRTSPICFFFGVLSVDTLADSNSVYLCVCENELVVRYTIQRYNFNPSQNNLHENVYDTNESNSIANNTTSVTY